MMTERQRKFREQYIAQVSPWYNGLLHITVTYGVGIAAIAWCVGRMQGATWEWLVLIPVAIGGNFVEWGMHKYVMHRLIDVFAIRAIYDRHTRQHHQYFTDNDVTIHTVKEFRIVFFPWRLLAGAGRDRRLPRLAHGAGAESQRRLRRLHHHDRPVPRLRDLPLLLPRAGELIRRATCRS